MNRYVTQFPEKSVSALFAGTDVVAWTGRADFTVKDLAVDSRRVRPGSLFIAVQGLESDGHRYVRQAVENGAVAIVVQNEVLHHGVPMIRVRDSRRAVSGLASRFFDYPAKKMKMVGITGTNGKTTVACLIEFILKQTGIQTGLIGTVIYRWPGHEEVAERTTPDAIALQKTLWQMHQAGVEVVSMEVSSHALAMDRVADIQYDVAVFMNLTQDHLDFHSDMADYAGVKSRLFRQMKSAGIGLVHADDPYAAVMVNACKASCKTFGESPGVDVEIRNARSTANGSDFDLVTSGAAVSFHTPLLGRFNVTNGTAAVLACEALGIEATHIRKALEKAPGVPGRMEAIRSDLGFQVVVDYAHTPDALANALQTAKAFTEHRLITVFGCGGDRDRDKRKKMGKIAADYSDRLFITSDNPRTEDPQRIISDILEGVPASTEMTVLENREQAIRQAIQSAEPGDTVMISGKGHEDYQIIGHAKHHFDDREVARKVLQFLETV